MFRRAKHCLWLILCWFVLVGHVWATPCDVDNDGDVDLDDLNLIQQAILARARVSGLDDPRDADSNGLINSIDGRLCALRCTRAKCSTINRPPFANAGPDQSVKVGDLVSLSGAASADPDGDPLRYLWTLRDRPLGSLAALIDAATVTPHFIADKPGHYLIQLIVNDGKADSVPDAVTVSTENSRPIANAGPDQSVRVGTLVSLNGGGSTDVDGDPLRYTWQLSSVPPGSSATLSNPDRVNPTLLIDRPGRYLIALTVSDGTVSSLPDTVVVTTENSPPVANPGANQAIPLGGVVTLDGSRSSDVDGDPLTFRWSLLARPAGSQAALTATTTVTPRFTADFPGTYVAQLIVNDGTVDSVPASVTLTTANAAPVANAGPDQTVQLGSLVILDGSASRDPEGALLAYAWSLTGKPVGSKAALSGANSVNANFSPDLPGDYILQLIVNDGALASAPDTVTISTANSRPVADAGPPQNVAAGSSVRLDGSASRDADGDLLTFSWSLTTLPLGSHAALSAATTINPSFTPDTAGVYVAQLIVSDGRLDSQPATVVITVSAANRKPLAVAAAIPGSASAGSTVLLKGTGSSDPDGDPLTWAWSIVARPAGSIASIVGPSASQTSFVPDVAGAYTIQLVVNDGKVDSDPALVVVEVLTGNRPPQITSSAVTSATAGVSYRYDVDATDPDAGDVLSWSLVTSPNGMSIDPVSGLIEWTPGDAQAGSQPVSVRVVDQGGLPAVQNFTIIVGPPNHPPVITSAGIAPQWTQLTPTGTPPSTRAAAGSAYDTLNDRLIVFGGNQGDGTKLNDVWVLVNATGEGSAPAWVQLVPTGGPPIARQLATAVYDATANRLIIYGGCTANCGTTLADVWVLTNANGLGGTPEWIALPAGGTRSVAGAAYDPISNRMIVFGGVSGGPFSDLDTVSVLIDANGVGDPRWVDLTVSGTAPPRRSQLQNVVYDPTTNRLIVFAGYRWAGNTEYNDAWVLTNANGLGGVSEWQQLMPQGAEPLGRQSLPISRDPNSNRLIIFGGLNQFSEHVTYDDSWVLTHANGVGGPPEWIKLQPTGPLPTGRRHYVEGYDPRTNRLVMALGQYDVLSSEGLAISSTVHNDTWVLANASGLCTVGQPCTFKATASDPDPGDAVTYSLDAAPAGMVIDAASGAIVWTPMVGQIGDHAVTVRATDRGKLFATQTFTATVAPVAVPNVVGLAPEWAESFISAADLAVGTKTSQGGAVTLNFDSLPSRQGWTYFAFNNSASEASVFAINAGTLFQNSFGVGFQGQGSNRYNFWDLVDLRLPLEISLRARVLQEEGDVGNPCGFGFGAFTAKEAVGICLGTNQLQDQRGKTGPTLSIDGTVFRDYRLAAQPGIGFEFFADGSRVHSGPTVATGFQNHLNVGDGTGGTNAKAEVTAYSFTQPRVVGQNPPAGTLVPNKTNVDLTIVDGPATETVPNLISLSQPSAEAAIVAANLKVGGITSAPHPTIPAGQVSDQSPLPNIHVPKETPVASVMSTGPPGPVNVAPVITSAPVLTATAGQTYAYQVTASDPDVGDVLTFTLPTAPTGMAINASTGLITWTPTLAEVGDHAATVRVTDAGGLFAEQSFTIAARTTNSGPIAVASLFNAQGLPACVAPPAGLVSWYPGDGDAADIVGPNSPNTTIGSPQFVPGKVGQGIGFDGRSGLIVSHHPSIDFDLADSFTIDTWIRVDGPTTSAANSFIDKRDNSLDLRGYAMTALLPPFSPPGTVKLNFGIISSHVQVNQEFVTTRAVPLAEYHHVTSVVDRSRQTIGIYLDGILEQEVSIAHVGEIASNSRMYIGYHNADTITNQRPLNGRLDEIEIFNRALLPSEIQTLFLAGSAGKCKLRVGDTVRLDGTRSSDPDGDTLAYRWTLLAKPAGSTAALNDASAAQPTFVADLQGSYRFQLVVNDGVADSAPSEISITVMDGNRPPIAVDDNHPVRLGQTLTVPAPGVMANDYDPDGNPLAAAKLSDPSNGSLAFNGNGSFSYTPNSSVFGPGATAHALLGTTFMPGQPKSIDINPQTNRIYVTNLFAGTLAVIDGAAGKVIALTPTNRSHIEDVAVNTVTSRLYVTGTATNNYVSDSTLSNEVTVIDGATSTRIAAIPVGNQPGHLAVNAATNRIYVANVADATVSVIDGTSNAVVATVPVGREPRQLRVNARTNRVYALSTLDNSVTVIDGASNAAVAAVPVGGGARFMVVDAEFERLYVANNADATLTIIDTMRDAVVDTVAVGGGPTAIALQPSIDRLYVVNSTANSVSILDRYSRANLGTIAVGASPQSIAANPFSNRVYVANAGDSTVSVIDCATDTVSATVAVGRNPQALAVNPVTDRLYTLDADSHTLSAVHVGDRFTYKLNDGTTDSNVATVTVVIEPASVPPVAASDAYSAQAGLLLTVPVPGVLGNDGDVAGNSLTAALVAGPAGGSLSLNANGSFTYLPRTGFVGTDSFTYQASNGAEQSNTATVRIAVAGSGAPTITSNALTLATATQTYNYDVDATDPDTGDVLTFTLPAAPSGMTINASTGLIAWTPTLAQIGNHPVTVRVTDTSGLFAEQSFTIAVSAPGPINQPPLITSTPATAASVGTAYSYDVDASDPDIGDVLTYSLTTAPAGMSIDPANGLIEWTPSAGQTGDQQVEVRVADGGGLAATQPFTITVSAVAVCTPPPADLISWWPGEGDALDRAAVNDGVAENGATFAPGLVGQAFRFDGVDDLIRIASSRTVGFGGPFSVEFWFNPTTTIGNSTPNQVLLAKGRYLESGFNAPVAIQVLGGDGRLLVRMPPAPALVSTTDTWPAGTWQHIALSWDGARYRLYVNGIEEAGLDNAFSIIDSTDPITLGNADGFAAASFAGLLDEPTLYNRAITPIEVAALHAARGLGKCTAGYSRADAGADQAVEVAATVTLDGSASRAFDGAPLSYQWTLSSLPASSTAALSDASAVKPTFVADQAGTYTLDLVVSNAGRVSSPDSVSITAAQVNHAPSITSTALTTATIGGAYAYPVTASDPDAGDTLTYSLPVAPAGMNINAASGLVQWTPVAGQVGSHNVSVRVQDAGGLFALQSFMVVVVAAPVPVSVPNVVGQEQGAAQSAITAAALAVGTVATASSDTVAAGRVISQDPAAGTMVNSGSAVNLVVSSGPAGVSLASIRVTPISPLILTGQTQPFVATGILANGSSLPLSSGLVWTSSNPAVASIDAAGVATALSEGSTTISVSQGGATGSTLFSVAQAAVGDGTLPVAQITSPADGASVAAAVPIVGTASDANFLKYVVEIAPFESGTFSTLVVGTAPVTDGTLATLDPTTLVNDLYVLRLTVIDRADNRTQTEITVQLSRDKKVGNFTLAFQDLNVPMAGIPISVVRSYDSRDKTKGDFGIGWRLDVQSLRLRVTGIAGQGWQQTQSGGVLSRTYTISPMRLHKVAITLPDGKVEEFDMTVSPSSQPFAPIQIVDAAYAPRPLTRGSLRALGETRLVTLGATGTIELLGESSLQLFDPQEFEYITAEGQVVLISRQDGVKQIRDRNGNTVSFSAAGITHSAGKSISFSRDALNRITAVTDPNGNVQSYGYDINGDLASHTDAEGRSTGFVYNYDHGLIEIRDPRGVRPIRNEYDDAGRLIRTIDAYGKEITYTHDLGTNREVITDRLGNATIHVYDDQGNVTQTADALGGVTNRSYDARGNTLSEQDPLGRTRTYTYDGQDNRVTETDPLGKTTTYTYDGSRQVLSVKDALGRTTSNVYDPAGNLTSTTDPAGKITSYTYDSRGLQLTRTDPLGNTTSYAYDASGNLTTETDALNRVTSYSYDANGNRLTQSTTRSTAGGSETLLTRFTYDKDNRLTETSHPDGSVTRIAYNAIGKQSISTDQLGRETKYDYDDMGRLVKTTYPDGSSETSAYDAEGRRIASTDRAGRTTTSTYDALGRLITTTAPDGSSTSTAYDAAGQVLSSTDARGNVSSYSYDAAGRRTLVTDALGKTTTFSYDDAGNQTQVVDANGNAVTFTYDNNNRRTRTTYADSTFDQVSYDALGRQVGKTDQAGKTTQYAYDALGRLTSVTDALGQVTRYTYDELGNQLTQTDAEGRTTSFAYDSMGRRTSRSLPLGQTERMSYDAAGNLKTKTDFNGRTTTYTYDTLNRLLRKTPDASLSQPPVIFTYTASGQRASMQDASGSTSYSYDNRDRLLSKVTPQGTLNYSYDAAGNLTNIHSNHSGGAAMDYAYDARNRLASVTDASGSTTYSYDAVGNLAGFLYPNGVQTSYTYNPLNRLTQVTGAKAATTLASYAYTLGPSGHRTAVTEASGRQVDYTYDDLYRLKSETISADPSGPNGAITYTYDKVGNRLTRNSTVALIPDQTFAYDFNDRLSGEGYDDNGNTLTSGSRSFGYDFENHLVTANGGVSFVYNGDGIRVAKTAGGVTTGFLVDDRNPTGYAQVLEEVVGGSVEKSYTYGLKLVSQKQATGVSFYGFDGHGSVRYLTDANGAVTDTYSYDAFGNAVVLVGVTPNVYLYAGEQVDSVTGLYYLRARYADFNVGRFGIMDMGPVDFGSSASLNRYVYALNDGINRVDPSGHLSIGVVAATVAILGIISVASPNQIHAAPLTSAYYRHVALGVSFHHVPRGSTLATERRKFSHFDNVAKRSAFSWKVSDTGMQMRDYLAANCSDSRNRIKVLTLAGHAWEDGIPGRGSNNDGIYANDFSARYGEPLGVGGILAQDLGSWVAAGRIKFSSSCTVQLYGCHLGGRLAQDLQRATRCTVVGATGTCGTNAQHAYTSGNRTPYQPFNVYSSTGSWSTNNWYFPVLIPGGSYLSKQP